LLHRRFIENLPVAHHAIAQIRPDKIIVDVTARGNGQLCDSRKKIMQVPLPPFVDNAPTRYHPLYSQRNIDSMARNHYAMKTSKAAQSGDRDGQNNRKWVGPADCRKRGKWPDRQNEG
jgi:hypothetical protein